MCGLAQFAKECIPDPYVPNQSKHSFPWGQKHFFENAVISILSQRNVLRKVASQTFAFPRWYSVHSVTWASMGQIAP
jgi:GH25 family lysozyme M1 (1,4-beta-N-acetylmuramidase)